jgi:hypothetical protein
MSAAVERLLDGREAEGLARHVDDDAVLDQVARLLNVPRTTNNGSAPKDAPVTTSDPDKSRKSSRVGS